MIYCAQIVPVKVKYFQTKPKLALRFEIESTDFNHNIFEFSKSWSENPRVAPQAHSIA
jgi:hypothetical protein